MISLFIAASDSSLGDTLIGGLILALAVAYGIYSYRQKLCQFCGYTKNEHKDQFPVCQQCGRNRLTGGAGPSHH